MATLTVNKPDLATAAGLTPVTATPSAADKFPAVATKKYLIKITGATANSITCKIDDPTTEAPPAATSFDPDVTLGPIAQTVVKEWKIDHPARFMDTTDFINITTTGVVTGAVIEITEL